MCQLTLLDLPDQKIARNIIRPHLELNTLGIGPAGSNHDGFGYMTFAQLGKIYKSGKSAEIWWPKHEKEFMKRHRNVNGIYHLRAASTMYNKKGEKEYAHPFQSENLVLMHNGTVRHEKNGPNKELLKEMPKDASDTQEFLYALDLITENEPLGVHNINQTLKNFKGPYCFMIWDKLQHQRVFIIRGEDRFLHKAEIFNDGEPWGIMINTMPYEIHYTMRYIMNMGKLLGYNLNYDFEELKENSIYEYKIGSHQLEDRLDKTYTHPKTTYINNNIPRMGSTSTPSGDDKLNWIIAEMAINKLDLTYTEILVLSEIVFGSPFLLFDEEQMDYFADLLIEFDAKYNHKGRRKMWFNIKRKADIPTMDIYKILDLEFPYFFNSKSELKKAEKNVR